MNVSQLQSPSPVQVNRRTVDASEKDANFLSFRQLNKRARVRLSPQHFLVEHLPVKIHLFAVANSAGWFAAVTRYSPSNFAVIFALLSDLHAAFLSTGQHEEIQFSPKRLLKASARPTIITFASNDTRMLVGLTDGKILLYDTSRLFTAGSDDIHPIHSWPPASPNAIQQILPNPGDMPNLVAILREPGAPQAVEIFDVHKLQSVSGWRQENTQDSITSLSWSPKGKQLAIGLCRGGIVTFSPAESSIPKFHVPVPSLLTTHILLSLTWLANTAFHTVYAPTSSMDIDQVHVVVTLDSKSSSMEEVTLAPPNFLLLGSTPNVFVLALRNWDPVKLMLIVGDGASSDIGVVGNIGDEWNNFCLEETVTPRMPLDKDGNETILVALQLDLTNDQTIKVNVDGDNREMPSGPILYGYTSDGTVQGWYVVNTKGVQFPSMVKHPSIASHALGSSPPNVSMAPIQTAVPPQSPIFAPSLVRSTVFGKASTPGQDTPALDSPSALSTSSPFSQQSQVVSAFGGQVQPVIAFGQATSAFAQPSSSASAFRLSSASAFGQSSTAFGQSSAFGQQSPSSSSTSEQQARSSSAFGQPSFGQPSIYGQPSNFGLNSTASPSFPGAGFSAFASASPAKFGQSAFKFGTVTPSPVSRTAPAEEMLIDNGSPFGGLSLGNSSDVKSESNPGSGIFGKFSALPQGPELPAKQPERSTFGSNSSGTIKPATGFGVLLEQNQSQIPKTDLTREETKSAPASAFGKIGFESMPAFRQSAFGDKATSVFGNSGFVNTSTVPAVGPTGSAFSAFAKGGMMNFADAGGGAFSESREPSKSAFSGANVASKSLLDNSMNANAFGGTVFGNSSAIMAAPVKPDRFSSLANPLVSPGSSPDSTGRSSPKDHSSPPAASVNKINAPMASPGVFRPPETSSSVLLKPASGFGAFGNDINPASSPFFNPASGEGKTTLPVSVFASAGPSIVKPVASTPTFGAPSALGGSKSAFGASSTLGGANSMFGTTTSSTDTLQKTATPSGGFSAFSGASSGFASVTGSKQSFGELLKGGDITIEPAKFPKSAFSVLPPSLNENPKQSSLDVGDPATSTTDSGARKEHQALTTTVFGVAAENRVDLLKPVSVFSPSLKPKDIAHTPVASTVPCEENSALTEAIPTNMERVPTSIPPATGMALTDDAQGHLDNRKQPSTTILGDESPSGSFSLSSGSSSFVEVLEPNDKDKGDKGDEPEDDAQSFLSENFSEDSEEPSDEDKLSRSRSPEQPGKTPLPLTPHPTSRSPSTTPKPDNIIAQVTPSPPSSPSPVSDKGTCLKRSSSPIVKPAQSTTPHGSPAKEPSSIPAPVPVTPAAFPTFAIGLGRPSNRPTRSSPLAVASVSVGMADDKQLQPSKSTHPPALKPHPASPKAPFGVWSSKPDISDDARTSVTKPQRPKTPPLLATFPTSAVEPPPGLGSSNLTPSAALSPKPTTPTALTSQNKLLDPNFGENVVLPPQLASTSTSSLLSSRALGSSPLPPFTLPPRFDNKGATLMPSATKPQLNMDHFIGKDRTSSSPTPPPFNQSVGQATSLANVSFALPSSGLGIGAAGFSVTPRLEPIGQQGMQAECLHLISSLVRELESLKLAAQEMSLREDLKNSAGSSPQMIDLDNHTKPTPRTLVQFGKTVKGRENDMAQLKEMRAALALSIRELQGHMLKAGTRKEEIVRFNRAKTDSDFGKILKVRTLGPEHLETQSQLRKDIGAIRGRIQKLEDHLQAFKKKLNQMRTCKPGFKAPSLDTINRTYRNIDIAIDQNVQDVANLTSRIAKLDLNPTLYKPINRDKRLPDIISKRPFNVTPHVAVTTAAALNAERSAQKLKRALLIVRKQPQLNTTAASAPAAPVTSNTPMPVKQDTLSSTMLLGGSHPFEVKNQPKWCRPTSDFNESPTLPSSLPTRRTAGGGGPKHHMKPVALRRNGPAEQSPPAPSFDWGPLPSVTPMTTISADVRTKSGEPAEASLSRSWMTNHSTSVTIT